MQGEGIEMLGNVRILDPVTDQAGADAEVIPIDERRSHDINTTEAGEGCAEAQHALL